MNKSTKIAALIVGVLLAVPPFVAGVSVLFGGHMSSVQGIALLAFGYMSVLYWIVLGSVLWEERNR